MKKLISPYFLAIISVVSVILLAEAIGSSLPPALAFFKASPDSRNKKIAYVNPADLSFSKKLDNLSIKLHPGSEYRKDSKPTTSTLAHCKSIVYQTLESVPENHSKLVKDLTLYFTQDGRRGLGAKDTVILRCLNVSDGELSAVLVHELGHLVDTGLLQGTESDFETEFLDYEKSVFEDDPSVAFYRTSWQNSKDTYDDASPLDFVSGYAMNDPFEDFAETYAYYMLHGAEFRKLAEENGKLFEKYTYMKDVVFDQKEFGGYAEFGNYFFTFYRNYDVTVLDYDSAAFLHGEF